MEACARPINDDKNMEINYVNASKKKVNILTYYTNLKKNEIYPTLYKFMVKVEKFRENRPEYKEADADTYDFRSINMPKHYVITKTTKGNVRVDFHYESVFNHDRRVFSEIFLGNHDHTQTYLNDQFKKHINDFLNVIKPYLLDILANGNFFESMIIGEKYFCDIHVGKSDSIQIHQDETFRTLLTYIKSPVTTEITLNTDSPNEEFNSIIPKSTESSLHDTDEYYSACPLIRFKTSATKYTTLCFNDDLVKHTVPIFPEDDFESSQGEAERMANDEGLKSKVLTRWVEKYFKFPYQKHRQSIKKPADRHVLLTFIYHGDNRSGHVDAKHGFNGYKYNEDDDEDDDDDDDEDDDEDDDDMINMIIIKYKEIDTYKLPKKKINNIIDITRENISEVIELFKTGKIIGDVRFSGGKKNRRHRTHKTKFLKKTKKTKKTKNFM